MFYVKGKSFLLSFSTEKTPSTSRGAEITQELLDSNTEEKDLSHDSHLYLHTFRNIGVLLMVALAMSAISYLYTMLLFPTVLSLTLRQNPLDNNNGTNTANYPLNIGCPQLQPRESAATNVHDLRPDDIKIVAGVGDR
jgi:phospholipase B1